MKGALVTVFATLFLCSNPPPLAAQPAAARVANPETVEFQVPRDEQAPVGTSRVELFLAGSDTTIAVPVKIMDLNALPTDNGEPVRIDIRNALEGVADGEYIATVRTVHADGTSARSQPTAPFVVSGYSVPRLNVSASAPASAAPNLTEEEKHRERFWTRVAIAVAAGVIILPFLVH